MHLEVEVFQGKVIKCPEHTRKALPGGIAPKGLGREPLDEPMNDNIAERLPYTVKGLPHETEPNRPEVG